MAFEYDETLYFFVAWLLGFFAATVRVYREHGHLAFGDCLSVGLSGGFFAFGVVGILVRYDPPGDGSRFFYLGVAALVGLLGKEQDLYLRLIIKKIMKTIGVSNDDEGK